MSPVLVASTAPALVVCSATCAREPLHVSRCIVRTGSFRSTTEAAEELDVDSFGHQRIMSFISDREQASAHRATTALGG